MGLGRRRERREERREERRGDGGVHYRMRQRLVSIGDDFWIETDEGQRAYKVDGKALRLRKTLILEDATGHEVAKIQERVMRVKDSMEVEDADGNRIAMVKKALISPLRDRWSVEIADGPDLDVQGNVLDHEYTITDGRTPVATISKKWFRVADTYGVEVAPGQDPVPVLAATVALDLMTHDH
ncbi:LURP-one-related/scramblase family protein [Jiangella endophytica]|uniref:LURP-one-related/scramblase family protein n=1 Tax=Jiangella endophytica TaxID=1623398 RepID=UPI0018E55639|nr:LURP-one-related family protein [Jiangella endophytica]